jgi:aryl carrier-like protein
LAKDPSKLVETYMAEKQDCIRELTQSSRFKVKRDRIALEIYSSEVTYVQSVQYLVEVVKPMAAKKKAFTKEQFAILFQGLDSIRDVSMNLIESLETRMLQVRLSRGGGREREVSNVYLACVS